MSLPSIITLPFRLSEAGMTHASIGALLVQAQYSSCDLCILRWSYIDLMISIEYHNRKGVSASAGLPLVKYSCIESSISPGCDPIELNWTKVFRIISHSVGARKWQLISKTLAPSLRGKVLLDLYLRGKAQTWRPLVGGARGGVLHPKRRNRRD